MRMLQLLILVAATFILLAATCRPLSTKDLDSLEPRIEMFKGPCFGSCPVYKLKIYEGGVAAYEGQRFTNRIGLHTKLLDQNTYRDLINAFEESNFWSYQNIYKAQIPDLPTVTLTYHKDGETKSVKGKDGRPERLLELEEMLTAIADGGGWERQASGGNYGLEEDVIADELLVNLSQEVDPSVWIIQFARQDLQIVKRLSPNSPYWLLHFNPERIAPSEMLEAVRRDQYVISAEFNRKVNATSRGR
ncbi:MAG: DUF6438 domain-containing protein [Bacteroidota bacterium]